MLSHLIHRPIAVMMVTLGMLLVAAYVGMRLPVSLLPAIDIPRVVVHIDHPQSSALSVETEIVAPLRRELLQVSRLVAITSEASDGYARILLDFPYGGDADLLFWEVNEKVDLAMEFLPREMARPRVVRADIADHPVLSLAVTFRDTFQEPGLAALRQLEMSELGLLQFRRRLEQLPSVAFADVSGYRSPEVRLIPRQAVWESLGLSPAFIAQVIEANRLSIGSIQVKDGQYQFQLRLDADLSNVRALLSLPVRHRDRVFILEDLVEVQELAREEEGSFWHDGQPGLIYQLRKQPEARLSSLMKELDELIATLESSYPDLSFTKTEDQTALLQASFTNLRSSLYWGVGFVILVLFYHYREWQVPLLLSLSIPASLLLVLLGLYGLGISLNVVSLVGMILGVGLMIDNGIIVMESIRQYEPSSGDLPAAVQGARSIIRPLLASALTTCSVFFPLLLLEGLAGAIFRDQAYAIALALTASLALSYWVLPTFIHRLDGRRAIARRPPSYPRLVRLVHLVLRRPLATMGLLILLLLGGIQLWSHVPVSGFPRISRSTYELAIDWQEELNLTENTRRTKEILGWAVPEGTSTNAYIGTQQFLLSSRRQRTNELRIIYQLPDREGQKWLEAFQRRFAATFPGALWTLQPLVNAFDQITSADQPPLVARVNVPSPHELPSKARLNPLLQYWSDQGLRPQLPPERSGYYLTLELEKLYLFGISRGEVVARIQALLDQRLLASMARSGRELPVLLATPMGSTGLQALLAASVKNKAGQDVPLKDLISVSPFSSYVTIHGGAAGNYLPVSFHELPDNWSMAVRQLEFEGRQLTWSGQRFRDLRHLRDATLILPIVFALLYLILAAQFESLSQPFIVLAIIPFSLVGSMAGLWLTGGSINLMSIIGMIVVCGIVVNDAILKVDMINRARREGKPLLLAIHIGGRLRFRAIMMTSITTILALMPILFASGLGAELQRPLAIAIIGGLSTGTVLSLSVLPLFYRWFSYRPEKSPGEPAPS